MSRSGDRICYTVVSSRTRGADQKKVLSSAQTVKERGWARSGRFPGSGGEELIDGDQMTNALLGLSRTHKRLIALSVDALLCVAATWARFLSADGRMDIADRQPLAGRACFGRHRDSPFHPLRPLSGDLPPYRLAGDDRGRPRLPGLWRALFADLHLHPDRWRAAHGRADPAGLAVPAGRGLARVDPLSAGPQLPQDPRRRGRRAAGAHLRRRRGRPAARLGDAEKPGDEGGRLPRRRSVAPGRDLRGR